MSRSSWKPVFVTKNVLKCIGRISQKKTLSNLSAVRLPFKKRIRVISRHCTITNDMVNMSFSVYNGKTFFLLMVVPEFISCKLGEFSFSKKRGALIHTPVKGKSVKKK